MAATAAGGLAQPLPGPTPALILVFPPYTGAGLAGVQVGAMIEVAAPALHPGTATEVRLSFWASEARAIAVSGARFRLWHGHTVGSGTVLVGADPGDGARP